MSSQDFIVRLEEGVRSMGLPLLSPSAQEKLAAYQILLTKWNSKINLTAHRTLEDSLEKNFLDSLSLIPFVCNGNLLDFGSGAGFPGLVLKICLPDLSLILVEADKRKSAFLAAVIRELDLSNARVVDLFLDSEKIQGQGWLGYFDTIVSRATMDVEDLLPLASLCLKKGGSFLGMAGPEKTLPQKWNDPSMFLEREKAYELPFSKLRRKIFVFRKA